MSIGRISIGETVKEVVNRGVIELQERWDTISDFTLTLLSLTTAAAWRSALGIREALSANRTYYVRTDGSDGNTGLVNSAGGAWLTPDRARVVLEALDFAGFAVTVQFAAGTYTGNVAFTKPFIGGTPLFLGDLITPTNVLWSTTGGTINLSGGARVNFGGFDLRSSAGNVIDADAGSAVRIIGNTTFGTCGATSIDMVARNNATIDVVPSYSVSGQRYIHMYTINGGRIQNVNKTVTLSAVTVDAAQGFCFADVDSSQTVFGLNFAGTVSGRGALAQAGGIIFTNSDPRWTPPAGTYPGNVANFQDGVGRIL